MLPMDSRVRIMLASWLIAVHVFSIYILSHERREEMARPGKTQYEQKIMAPVSDRCAVATMQREMRVQPPTLCMKIWWIPFYVPQFTAFRKGEVSTRSVVDGHSRPTSKIINKEDVLRL